VKLLLDTHVVLWASRQPRSLSPAVRAVIEDPDNQRVMSAVTPWELSIKAAAGKLPEAVPLVAAFDAVVAALAARELPITRRHAVLAGQLSWRHRDPFDRMLVAQAVLENLTLVTKDRVFDTAPDLRTLW
jgi:PIN domain nuclease of toxin-antitoxin system